MSCIKERALGLVIVREALAAEVLAHTKEYGRGVPVVVLLEPDGWANRAAYLKMGAAVLAQSSGRQRILEAVAELTSRAFPDHVRVPFTEFVEIMCPQGSRMAETVDMSTTGMGLRYVPEAVVGDAVRIQVDSLDPPLSLPAVVIRNSNDTVGLRFLELEPALQKRLEHLVDVQSARFPPPEMPEGLTVDLAGTFTMELLESGTMDLEGDARFKNLLASAVVDDKAGYEGWPRWLINIEKKLTDLERRDFGADPMISHAAAAVDLRISLARIRSDEPYTFPTPQLVQQVLDFSRLLEDYPDAPDADLADISTLRGHLLRAVYGDLSKNKASNQATAA